MGSSVRVDREGRWLQGRINFANLKESQRIWRLVDTHYIPVDWQLDFKSGYRWSEETWYLNILSGHKAGVDIKSRGNWQMQHLPSLAWAWISKAWSSRFDSPIVYSHDSQSDTRFISTNRHGSA
jgi:hypothetical protein